MEDSSINILDLVVAGVVLVSALLAFYRGFVREALAIVGWVGAFFVTVWLFPQAQPYAHEWVSPEWLADLAAGATIFLISLVVLWLIAHAIVTRVKGSPLNALDRSLGFLFGVARGLILVALAYMAANQSIWRDDEGRPEWVTEARTLPIIDRSAGLLVALVPEGTFNLPVEGFEAIQRKSSDLEDAREMIEDLRRMAEPPVAPVAPADGEEGDTGYKEAELQIMDRLFENQTEAESESAR